MSLGDLGVHKKNETIHCVKQNALHLTRNMVNHTHTNYIDVQYDFVREFVEDEKVSLQKFYTNYNVADIIKAYCEGEVCLVHDFSCTCCHLTIGDIGQ